MKSIANVAIVPVADVHRGSLRALKYAKRISSDVRVARWVVCQKALAPGEAQAREIVETAEAAGVPLVVHENFRFSPWYREARRLLEAGTLGVPHSVAFRLRPGDGQGPSAYLDRQPYFREMPRLLVYETAIHFVDTFRYLLQRLANEDVMLGR